MLLDWCNGLANEMPASNDAQTLHWKASYPLEKTPRLPLVQPQNVLGV